MMVLKSAILKTPHTGICKIDVGKVIEAFNKECSISKWREEYFLIKTESNKIHLKVQISQEDAKKIIKDLKLIKTASVLYSSASMYRLGK